MPLTNQLLAVIHVDQSLNWNTMGGSPLLLLLLRFVLFLLEPPLPMLLFVLIGRDPVKEDHDVLRLGVLDGSLAKGGVAAHVKKTLILLVVLHRFKNISNLVQPLLLPEGLKGHKKRRKK